MSTIYSISVAHTNDYLTHGQTLEATRGLPLIYGISTLCGPILGGITMNNFGPPGFLLC